MHFYFILLWHTQKNIQKSLQLLAAFFAHFVNELLLLYSKVHGNSNCKSIHFNWSFINKELKIISKKVWLPQLLLKPQFHIFFFKKANFDYINIILFPWEDLQLKWTLKHPLSTQKFTNICSSDWVAFKIFFLLIIYIP
jgi:hypothetical protein